MSQRVRLYFATSLDGFIADRDGSVDWLEAHDPEQYGYPEFFAEIGALVMGRRTYEFVRTMGDEWPYRGRRTYVLSSRPLTGLPDGVIPTPRGMSAAIASARAATSRDVWVVGGAITMQAALDEGHVDLIETFIMPVLLGRGLPVIADLSHRAELSFQGIETFPDGVVKLAYEAKRPPDGGAT